MMVPALPVMSDAPPMATPAALARERDTAEDDTTTIETFPIILKGKERLSVSQCSCRTYTKSPPMEGTEKLKPTIKLKVDDGEIAVLPFIICLF